MTGVVEEPQGGQITEAHSAPQNGGGSSGNAWATVALLCLLIGASFLDRNIIALLVDPIRHDLGTSDRQVGLLFGVGFAIFYVLAGIPLAHFADRGSRKKLLLFGVLLWSLTTLAAAFSTNFATLAIARAGVAIGEAVLTPVAVSLIADLFPHGKRSLPTSLYLTSSAMMGAASPILGGAAYALARAISDDMGIAAWRLTFAVVAMPGIILAFVYALMIREPARQQDISARAENSSMGAAFSYFFSHFALFGTVFLGVGVMLINAMAISAWGPTMLIREHAMSPAQAGIAMGGASLIGAIAGSLSVPIALRFLPGASEVRRIIVATAIFPLLMVPVMAVTATSASLPLALFGISVGIIGVVAGPVLAPLLVQAAAPAQFRARMTAFYLTFNVLFSLGFGPVLVPLLADYNPARPIGGALSLMAWSTLFVALASYTFALRKSANINPQD